MRLSTFCMIAGMGGALLSACSSPAENPDEGFIPSSGGSKTTSGGSGSNTTTGTPGSGGSTTGSGGDSMTSGAGGNQTTTTDGGGNVSSEGGGTTGTDPRTNVNLVWKSTGCGKPVPAGTVPTVPGSRTGYKEYHIKQTGATLGATDPTKAVDRLFWVRVPADYDQNKPYRVVYILQGCGGGNGRDNTWPLYDEKQGGSEQAIYVAVALPPNMPNGACYDNRAGVNSQEWEDFQMMHDVVEAAYCADNNRIEMAGYSSGGWVANMWGCYFGGIPTPARKFAPNYALRVRASVTGGLPDVPMCSGPVAGIWIHDAGDKENVIKGSYDARDLTLKMNGCANSKTEKWAPDPDICVQYTDCPKEYPVVFCTTNGQGHSDQPTRAIPDFKKFYDLLAPTP